jgi:hypothetical protein
MLILIYFRRITRIDRKLISNSGHLLTHWYILIQLFHFEQMMMMMIIIFTSWTQIIIFTLITFISNSINRLYSTLCTFNLMFNWWKIILLFLGFLFWILWVLGIWDRLIYGLLVFLLWLLGCFWIIGDYGCLLGLVIFFTFNHLLLFW